MSDERVSTTRPPATARPGSPAGRVRLLLAVALFLGWLSWLGYAAVTKSHAPIVSHAQAAAAKGAVVAEIKDLNSPIEVVELVWGEAPAGPTVLGNLGDAQGFTGPGKYLVYVTPRAGGWFVVGPQPSPGSGLTNAAGPGIIYPWSDDVRKQAEKLKR